MPGIKEIAVTIALTVAALYVYDRFVKPRA